MELFFLSSQWLPTIFLVLFPILSLSLLLKQRKVKQETNLPPGPSKLPIIGNLHQVGKLNHISLWKLSQKYGPAMFLQLGQIPTLKLTYNYLTLAFCPYNDSWKNMQKIFRMELLSKTRVQSFEYKRKAKIVELNNYITQASPNPIELSEKALSLTYSVICQIAFNKNYDEIEGSKFKAFVQESMELFGTVATSDIIPWFGGIVDALTGLPRRIEYCHRRFDSFFEKLIEEHLDPTKQKSEQEVIDVMLNLSKDEKAQFNPTKEHIKAVLMDIVLGGVDTSAITITWVMTELVRNPRLENLQYLKMVLKETFRLHPPLALLIPLKAISHFKIGGYDINPKTRIMINVYAIGRDPKTWKNPNEFYPERFEEHAIDFRGQNFELLPFGSGRRMCPGINMASTVVMVTLANLLYRFDWKLPNGMKREDVSVEEGIGLTIYRKLPLYLVPVIYDFEKTLDQ
ncbi:hypothetical protein ACB098_05G116000 [Castanea mollissima]